MKKPYELFYKGDLAGAKDAFVEANETYGAGLCSFLVGDIKTARKFFEAKEEICTASNFGLIILDIIEGKPARVPKYFQVRSFLEIYINLLIENRLFEWAQKIIDNYEFFTRSNFEVPKFMARVLYANGYDKAVHSFAKMAYEICFYDAEIHYIEASVYMKEKNYEEAKKCVSNCLAFAKEYYPILKIKEELEKISP